MGGVSYAHLCRMKLKMRNISMMGKRIPLAGVIVAFLILGGVGAATLWVTSFTASVSFIESTYLTLAFSDAACTIPLTNLNFGAVVAQYSGDSVGEWKTVTLQIQTPVPAGTQLKITGALTGTLPAGASIECQRQKIDLTWVTETIAGPGFFSAVGMGSPLVDGLQTQSYKYRIVFEEGSTTGTFNGFGISYTVEDLV